MTTKGNPKIEHYGNLEKFYETKWSKQSATTYKQAQKMFESTKVIEISNE